MKTILLLLLPFFIISCDGTKNKTPDNVINRDTMIRLMADMDITEAALKHKQATIKRDSLEQITERAYDSLYLYYSVTPDDFLNSLKYYQEDPEMYLKMMEDKLTLLTRKIDSLKIDSLQVDSLKADSLKVNRLQVDSL